VADDFSVVRAGIPEMDDCKILTRLKAFLVDQGVAATIEHVFRDRQGRPADLSRWVAAETSLSGSTSSSTPPAGTVKMRAKEWMGRGLSPTRNPIWEVYGDAVDPAAGVLRFELDEDLVEHAGIYEMDFAVINESGKPVAVDRGILSVEKSMFPTDLTIARKDLGPPTIQEVRMRLMDSSRNENLLLDDIEFKDEQILAALWEPIRLWNESPPPIRTYTTRDFPFRGAWIQGVLGQLHMTMAAHYRRNVFRGAAGGTSDKDKEREYMAEGQRLWQEYTAWMFNKKVEINLKGFAGHASSPYVGGKGW
jgi:hypothetical protein